MLELDKAFKGFRTYPRSQGTFVETTAVLHRDFKFMGESGVHYFFYYGWWGGRKSLPTRKWMVSCGGYRRPYLYIMRWFMDFPSIDETIKTIVLKTPSNLLTLPSL